jgi:hypothetical protein
LQRNPEGNIAGMNGRVKIRLPQVAIRRVGASLNREEAVNAAVARTVRAELEARFTKCALGVLERWHGVGPAQTMSNHVRRIHRRRAAADRRLEVADEALVGIEDGAHSGRVDQLQGRKRVAWIRIDRGHALRPLRTGVARAFEFGNTEEALIKQSKLIYAQARYGIWNGGLELYLSSYGRWGSIALRLDW